MDRHLAEGGFSNSREFPQQAGPERSVPSSVKKTIWFLLLFIVGFVAADLWERSSDGEQQSNGVEVPTLSDEALRQAFGKPRRIVPEDVFEGPKDVVEVLNDAYEAPRDVFGKPSSAEPNADPFSSVESSVFEPQ